MMSDMDAASAKQRRANAPTGGSNLPLAQAYVRYRPLLFSALSRLARHGFAASPHDGLDLIHDFFVEAWEPLIANYDADKAKFETYLYAAFVRFVRPRIVRLRRWTDALVEPAQLAILDTPDLSAEPPETSQRDLAAVSRAVNKLVPFERALLSAYVASPTSERDLAERFSLTRYRLRLSLADALGKTAAHLGDTDALDPAERAVVDALWRDGRTIKEAARALARTTPDVQALRLQFFEKLSRAVKGDSTDPHSGSRIHPLTDSHTEPQLGKTHHMSHAEHLPDAQRLLEAALESSMRGAVLDAVQKNSEIIVAFLNDPASDAFFERHASALTPDVLAALYSALGSTEHVDPDDAALLDALLEASDHDERRIGEAFAEVLVPNLPDDFTKFRDLVFLGAPPVDTDLVKHLQGQMSVIYGGPAAMELTEAGLTPVSIIEASQGVANLARRFCREHEVKRFGNFILDKAGRTEGYSSPLVLSKALAVAEVELMCELPHATAERLFVWLARAAEYAPALFDGFDAELRGDELRLTRTDDSIANPFLRWLPPPNEIAA